MVTAGQPAEVEHDASDRTRRSILPHIVMTVAMDLALRKPLAGQQSLCGGNGFRLNVKCQYPSGVAHQSAQKSRIPATSGGGVNAQITGLYDLGGKAMRHAQTVERKTAVENGFIHKKHILLFKISKFREKFRKRL
jgi:hypothetical protein